MVKDPNGPTAYKSVARRCAPMASSPRLLNRQTGTVQTPKLCKKPPVEVHHRSANLIVGDGTKNGLPAPNKEPATIPKQPLDRKSPIQVRIRLPPPASLMRTRFPGSCTPR